jgi:hypothetical protein
MENIVKALACNAEAAKKSLKSCKFISLDHKR